jgi:prephenate dehydrogenase
VKTRTAGIVGLGLIGGSVARDLARNGVRVLGHDDDDATLAAALESGVLDGALGERLEGINAVDWLVIAVPVNRAPDVLARAAPHLGRAALVTDVGSTKRSICAAAAKIGLGTVFVGSHPFAGDHRSGWPAGRAGLFERERVFLCDTGSSSEDALHAARTLWSLCGADCHLIDAADHDRLVAWTSHLPQILSYTLAAALAAGGIRSGDEGRGAHDMLRLAGSNPGLWAAIAADNADNIIPALHHCEQTLAALRTALGTTDVEEIGAVLDAAAAYRRGASD